MFLKQYELLEEIGFGAMGVVYLAQDLANQRNIALKENILPKNCQGALKESLLKRFRREALLTSTLRHPGIVKTYNFAEEGSRLFLAMEYVPGKTLKDILECKYPLTYRDFFKIYLQIIDALNYAHGQGVVHRDIKPDNIKILDDLSVKIMDFGIARFDDAPIPLTADGEILGSFTYMSPEQVQNAHDVDYRADYFSLGVMMYETLAGRLPFDADNVGGLIQQIMQDSPPALHQINANTLPLLEKFVFTCMAKTPERRFQDGKVLNSELLAIEASASDDVLSSQIAMVSVPSEVQSATVGQIGKYRILHVEDDEIVRKVFSSSIKKSELPYAYDGVASLAEAKDALQSRHYDFLVCDYLLPDGNSLSLLDRVEGIPVIMMTSVSEPQTIVQVMKRDVVDYIVKSTALGDAQKVLAIVSKYLEN